MTIKSVSGLISSFSTSSRTAMPLRFMNVSGLARSTSSFPVTARAVIGKEEVLLAKPETFMNLSGMAVRELVEKLEIRPETDLIVIYDELDLPMGQIRIRQRGSSAGHNGMKSIIGALGTQEFVR